MMKYLWDFSFEELFLSEGGEHLLKDLTVSEWIAISKIKQLFEKVSEASRTRVQMIDPEQFAFTVPALIMEDAILQLCLIYSLSVQEIDSRRDQMEETIKREASLYYKEYRGFRQMYSFEQYSFFNRIENL